MNPKNNQHYTAIPLHVLAYIAWRNLVTKKLRTILTMFGIIIGIGAIFFLMTFGLGLRDLVTQQVVGDKSIKSIEVNTPNSKILKLDNTTVSKLRGLPHVSQVGTSYSFPGSVIYQSSEIDVVTYGVTSDFESLDGLQTSSGRLLSDHDNLDAVINQGLLKDIGVSNSQQAIGKKITVTIPLSTATNATQLRNTFTVVGVLDSSTGSELYLPGGIFQGAGVPSYSQIKMSVSDTSDVNNVRRQIESLGYQTTSPIDTISQINQIFKFFTFILVGFGAIGMIVSVLGMFNTMTISLLERTKEIGLMMALGGRASDMRKLFIFEASLMSFTGAVLGVILAVSLGQAAEFAMNNFAHRRGVTQSYQIFSYPWWALTGVIAFMMIVGLMVVYFPARRAERINPIDALRRE